MNVLIIEDEYPAAERIERLLERAAPDVRVLGVLDSVAAACAWLDRHPAPDLILSDIQLADGLSFEIYERRPVASPIIFTTAFDEYAVKAFKVNSIDYLLKPVKLHELETSLERYRARTSVSSPGVMQRQIAALLEMMPDVRPKAYKDRFLVAWNGAFIPVAQEEVAYFTTSHELVYLVRRDGRRFAIDFTLEQLEGQLDPWRFYRANRQFLIHAEAVQTVYAYFGGRLLLALAPDPKEEVLVSRSKAAGFKRWLEGAE